MKRLKLFFLMALFHSMIGVAANYNDFNGICNISFNRDVDDSGIKHPVVRRAPGLNPNEIEGFLNISFDVSLPDAVIVIQCNGEELYSENYLNIVCGDTFSYSLTEAGEYTTFVYVNGELVEEETILVNP